MPTATLQAGETPGRLRIPIRRAFAEELHELSVDATSHDVEIKGDDGTVLFAQKGVRAPARWSKRAVQVAASKYLFGDPSRIDRRVADGGRERSIYDLAHRVAKFLASRGVSQGYFDPDAGDRFYEEIVALALGQYAAFNSPVWFNVGVDQYGIQGDDEAYAWDAREYDPGASWDAGEMIHGAVRVVRDTYRYPQGSACFIQSVDDDLRSIMDLATKEAMLFKYGSGSGTDLSTIRSKREKLGNGGTPSGPVSFMRVYDTVASVIKSGGKTRRAAKMQTLLATHPDIMEFIEAKGKEEDKAHALIAMGYDANFNGEAYSSVMFQNANLSVRCPGSFMNAVERSESYWLRAVTDGRPIEATSARKVWDAIARATWRCGDPGVQFSDTINLWHTTPYDKDGRETPINSSNPCSEYLSVDDSACNLASINLMRFVREDGSFDVEKFKDAVRLLIIAQEILVDSCSYPTRAIAQNAHDYRQLGLGFANLGGLLQSQGLPYDSEESRIIAGSIASLMGGTAYGTSAMIASVMGPFDAFAENKGDMQDVMKMHREAAWALYGRAGELVDLGARSPLGRQARDVAGWGAHGWDAAHAAGDEVGYRNAQTTLVAPTGTIAFMMDCDTTGIEPNLALVAHKTLAGGGSMTVTNRLVGLALDALGFHGDYKSFIEKYIADNGTAEGCPYLTEDQVAVFDTSFSPPGFSRVIDWRAHLLMMADVQRFISGAISKTVNVPEHFSADQIGEVYLEAWRLGLKCVAIYRDNSKGSQPLAAVGAKAGLEEKCHNCGHPNLQVAGTCAICPECGTPQGGCS